MGTGLTRCKRIVLIIVWLVSCTSGPVFEASAQECHGCPSQLSASTDVWTIRKQVNEVQILFTASQHGALVTGLTRNDIEVRDNGRRVVINDFWDASNLPLRVMLLIDTTDSIRTRFRFEKQAANLFLRHVLRSDADKAMVAGFNTDLQVTQGFTHDLGLLATGIDRLLPGGSTALFDAVGNSCRMLAHHDQRAVARVIVLVSDGADNASKISLQTALTLAEDAEEMIYVISTNREGSNCIYDNYGRLRCSDDANLRRLAGLTGGQVLFVATVRELDHAFARIAENLRHRYAVGYRPPDLSSNGRFHHINIRGTKAGNKLRIRARKGYYER